MARILVAEDRLDIRMSLEAMLEEGGHEVEMAENGKEALEKLQNTSFDLVISDVMMPELDGIELMMALQVGMGPKKPKVVVISGGGFNMLADDLLAKASDMADDVLRKPFTNNELSEVIGNVLNQHS